MRGFLKITMKAAVQMRAELDRREKQG